MEKTLENYVMNAEQEEYELQHFNFCTDQITSQNRHLLKYLIQTTYSSFTKEYIRQHNVEDEEAQTLLSASSMKSRAIVIECGPMIAEISKLYRSTFMIPDNILLPTDLLQRKAYTQEELDSMQATVNGLANQIRHDGVFLSMLEQEIKLYEQLTTCAGYEENVIELVDRYRQMEIIPVEDCIVDVTLAMKDVT